MGLGHAYQRWLAGGVVAAIVVLAVGWFLLIGPRYSQATGLHERAAAAELRLPTLEHRLAELRRQNDNRAQYEAQLTKDRKALPTTSGLPDFLRELQQAGDNHGVGVTDVTVGGPLEVTGAGATYYALPITLTAEGKIDALGDFLNELQQVQPRAVLINSANLAAADKGAALTAGTAKLMLSLQVFVSAPAGGATPSAAAAAKS
jgi:Tfp pilus assembly protein PilO